MRAWTAQPSMRQPSTAPYGRLLVTQAQRRAEQSAAAKARGARRSSSSRSSPAPPIAFDDHSARGSAAGAVIGSVQSEQHQPSTSGRSGSGPQDAPYSPLHNDVEWFMQAMAPTQDEVRAKHDVIERWVSSCLLWLCHRWAPHACLAKSTCADLCACM